VVTFTAFWRAFEQRAPDPPMIAVLRLASSSAWQGSEVCRAAAALIQAWVSLNIVLNEQRI